MTFRTAVRQGSTMHKNTARLTDQFLGLIQRQLAQILDFVTFPAGGIINLFSFRPVFMTLFAGRMLGSGKTTIGHLPMAIRTSHPILSNVKVVAEREFVIIFLVTARQCNHRQ